jgi:hypothetical protein
MSAQSNARRRQEGTGERYTTALMHVRHACVKCQRGTPCDGCYIEPCYDCRPTCAKETNDGKCHFDDVVPGGKACAYCGKVWRRRGN